MKKKNIIIISIIIIAVIAIMSVLYFSLYSNSWLRKQTVEIVGGTKEDISKEFALEDYETIISQKYKITCSTDECLFDIPFDNSAIPELDKSRTKIFIMIYSIENKFVSPLFGEINKDGNRIYFKILDYQAPNPLNFYAVVIYNPNMESTISD